MASDYIDNTHAIPAIADGMMNSDGLALVHSTRYKPVINEDGSVTLPSTYVATEGREARNTVHFALNHKVSSHLQGAWGDSDYAIIAPFSAVMRQEGPPAMLMPSDTFWTTNATDPLTLPQATVVMPGPADMKDLVTFDGNIVRYKTGGFTDVDEHLIAYECGDQQRLARASGPAERERILRGCSMEHATHAAINHLGFAVEQANQWHWLRPDYHHSMADRLAAQIGTGSSIPHMRTPYHGLENHMGELLTLADYYEAKAGLSGNRAKDEDGDSSVFSKTGERIGTLKTIVVQELARDGALQESLGHLRDFAAELDPRTHDVARDFSQKILQRLQTAQAVIAAMPKVEADVSGNIPAKRFSNEGPVTISMRRVLEL